MKNGWIKLIMILMIALLTCGALYAVVYTKDIVLDNFIKTSQFSLAQVEARQYVSQIEYSLRYGKQLTYYFNMDEILQKIRMMSSYIQNVYITDDGMAPMYAAEAMDMPVFGDYPPREEGADYKMYSTAGYTYYVLEITGNSGPAGYMVIKLDASALRYLVETSQNEAKIRSLVISGLGLMFAAIVLIRMKVQKKGRIRYIPIALFMVTCVMGPQLGDMALESYNIRGSVENVTTLSVNRMAQVMQKQIDSVIERGVDYEYITGLGSFFEENARSIGAVEKFTMSAENVVSAVASPAYINTISNGAREYFKSLLSYELIWAAALMLMALLLWKISAVYYRKNPEALNRGEEMTSRKEPSQKELIKALSVSSEQNTMIIQKVEQGQYEDSAIFLGSVRVKDTLSERYMFSARNVFSLKRLLKTASGDTGIFFVSGCAAKNRLLRAGYVCMEYQQWIMKEPAAVDEDKRGFAYMPVEIQDIDQIVVTYPSKEFDRAYIKRRIEQGFSVCARKDGRLAGYMLTHADGETGPLYVFPEYHGNQLGSQLIHRISKILQENGLIPLGHIDPENEVSIHLHQKAGYHMVRDMVMWVYSNDVKDKSEYTAWQTDKTNSV